MTMTQDELAAHQAKYAHDSHAFFLKEYGHFLTNPARITREAFEKLSDANLREVVDAVVGMGMHVDLTIYDKGDQDPVFGLVLSELTDWCSMLQPARDLMPENEDRQYYFRFVTRRSALDFVHALSMCGDDYV